MACSAERKEGVPPAPFLRHACSPRSESIRRSSTSSWRRSLIDRSRTVENVWSDAAVYVARLEGEALAPIAIEPKIGTGTEN